MSAWSLLGIALALVLMLDAFDVRRRLRTLVRLSPRSEPGSLAPGYVLWAAAGVTVDEGVKDGAIARARAEGVELVDLLPERWGTYEALLGVRLAAAGRSCGQAVLVSSALLERARFAEAVPTEAGALSRAAATLQRYSGRPLASVRAPGLRGVALSTPQRLALYRAQFSLVTPCVLAAQSLLLCLVAAAALHGGWALSGVIALMVHPLVSLAGTGVQPRDLLGRALLAWPWQVWDWVRLATGYPEDPSRARAVAALRPAYAVALARGTAPFFEARRSTCYVCRAAALHRYRCFADFWQRKPGRFELERCASCGHLQQNPPLSGEGLAFYYRDFYDGLGTEALELILGMNPAVHLARARFVTGSPRRWLDVGGGYGHFCAAARRVWTETRFECLDMGAGVEEAVRRGWAHEGHRGQLTELAPRLEGKYDVVSMSHYLEHTRDPRAELAAALGVLAPGGRLFIEVPDPECLWRLGLGPFWAPYLQPQHQHLLSVKNLSALLAEGGFDVERVERGEAKLGDDATLACLLWVKFLAPEDSPWRPPAGRAHALKVFAVPFLATPLFAFAWLVDRVTRRLRHVPGGSNAYRVLARKRWTQEQAA